MSKRMVFFVMVEDQDGLGFVPVTAEDITDEMVERAKVALLETIPWDITEYEVRDALEAVFSS